MSEEKDELKIYEIGFHLLPTLAVENIGAEFNKIKGILEKNESLFLSEELPKLRPLAYQMSKQVDGKKTKFDRAFFGWIKFQAESQAMEKIKKEIDALDNVLRFIIIKTIRENIIYTPRPRAARPNDSDRVIRRNKEEQEKAAAAKETPISEAELDKTIEELVVS